MLIKHLIVSQNSFGEYKNLHYCSSSLIFEDSSGTYTIVLMPCSGDYLVARLHNRIIIFCSYINNTLREQKDLASFTALQGCKRKPEFLWIIESTFLEEKKLAVFTTLLSSLTLATY